MRGKKGPTPELKNRKKVKPADREDIQPVWKFACRAEGCGFLGDTLSDWEAHTQEAGHAEYDMKRETAADPTAEEIVGEENVVDVGSATEEKPPEHVERQGYKCSQPGCTFQTSYLSEMEEHCNGTGHGYVTDVLDPIETQLPLPGIVRRNVEISMPETTLNAKRKELSECYRSIRDIEDEKAASDAAFKARSKPLEQKMEAIDRILRNPVTYEKVEAEWRVIEGENARGLFRLDTGEMIEKEAINQDDREEELQQAQTDNQQAEESLTL